MSARIFAVWGPPHAGKTVTATKLAECLYRKTHASVVVLYTDLLVPTLSVLFPNLKRRELYSVGDVLAETDIYANDIVSHLVTRPECVNLGYMGYCNGENRYSFPEYHAPKAESFMERLCEVADYLVVDCMSDCEASVLNTVALQKADTVIRLYTPELSCFGFYQSQSSLPVSQLFKPNREIRILNLPESAMEARMGDVGALFDGIAASIPYSSAVKEQYMEGELPSSTKDKHYLQALSSIVEAVCR